MLLELLLLPLIQTFPFLTTYRSIYLMGGPLPPGLGVTVTHTVLVSINQSSGGSSVGITYSVSVGSGSTKRPAVGEKPLYES